MRRVARSTIALALGVALVACALAAGNGNPNPGVLPPDSNPHGMSYGQWGDAWWQWALSFPVDSNPMLDPDGRFAAQGQAGSVWLLAGDSGGAVTRTITVPAGKTLFFPILNFIYVNTPDYGDPEWSPEQEAFVRALCKADIDAVTSMDCEIDGQPVGNLEAYRSPTPAGDAFMVTVPDNNVFGIPAGTYGPSIQDGIWLMLTPLSAGQHTIHFAGTIGDAAPFGGFSLDVTYNITVK